MPPRFRLALTADFHDVEGRPRYRDLGLDRLPADRFEVTRFDAHRPEIESVQLADIDAALVLTPRVSARSLERADRLLAIARFGVGYDTVDVAACTARDVALLITAGAVDRPVAEATVGWMLALTHQIRMKDRLVREARWDDRSRFMGCELRERTLGVVGFGGIGRAVVGLLAGFGMNRPLVFDPFADANAVRAGGAEPTTLDDLLRRADFVSLHCPLSEATRNLIGPRELALMKPTSYLINTARGGIVDEDALYAALCDGRLAGAALDCFATEPLTAAPKFAELDNVLLAPHCIAWTDELFRDIGRTACQSLIDLVEGHRPKGIVNPDVLDRPGFQVKWNRACGASR